MIVETIVTAIVALIIGAITILISNLRSVNSADDRPRATLRDGYLYIAMFITLCISISNFISIVFAAIDKVIPDTLKNGQNYNPYNEDMRFAIASLVVMFPLYLYFAFYTSKDIITEPKKATLAIRKNIFYLIAVITGITIIGTFIFVIYNWLGGELTSRFMSKAFVTLLVAVGVFTYTRYSLSRDFTIKNNTPIIIACVTSLMVLIGIVFSVNVLGTPGMVRKLKFDDKRLQDLSNIQQQVLSYWQTNKKLPAKLTNVQDQFSAYSIPNDPRDNTTYTYNIIEETKYVKGYGAECLKYKKPVYDAYGYEIKSAPSVSPVCDVPTPAIFELCANFETERKYSTGKEDWAPIYAPSISTSKVYEKYQSSYYSVDNYYYGDDTSNPFWDHKAEKTCFKRTIDSVKYSYGY